jgi:hypothetical protein
MVAKSEGNIGGVLNLNKILFYILIHLKLGIKLPCTILDVSRITLKLSVCRICALEEYP